MPPVIDREKCTGCGDCLFECGVYVFEFDVQSYRARVKRGTDCVECFICEKTCPVNAITVYFKGLKKGTAKQD
jgi:adenylylsulfate reductase, subunit B